MLETELVSASQPDSRRLMVVLHGLGDSMEGYRWLPETLRLPWLNYLLVNAPDPYFGGFSWYDFSGDADAGVRRSRKLLFEVLEHARAQGYPTEQTVLFGFSQGCLMTLDVGLRYPHRLAGLVGISGYAHQPEELMGALSPWARELPILVTHGTLDPLIPFVPVKRQFEGLTAQGLKIQWHEFEKVHTIEGERELRVIRDFVSACLPSGSGT